MWTRRTSARVIEGILAGWLALTAGGIARAEEPPAAGEQEEEKREKLERFRRLPDEEQRRLRRNFHHWKKLSAEEQEALRRRHEAYSDQVRRALEKLSPEERERLHSLPFAERRRAVRQALEVQLRRNEESFLQTLPAEKREALSRLPAKERKRAIFEIRRERIERDQRAHLEREVQAGRLDAEQREKDRELIRRCLQRGDLSREEAARIESLPESSRRREIGRLHNANWARAHPSAWERVPEAVRDRLLRLPPSDFRRELRRFLPERPEGEAPPCGSEKGTY
jgi:hypothetical protein